MTRAGQEPDQEVTTGGGQEPSWEADSQVPLCRDRGQGFHGDGGVSSANETRPRGMTRESSCRMAARRGLASIFLGPVYGNVRECAGERERRRRGINAGERATDWLRGDARLTAVTVRRPETRGAELSYSDCTLP